MTDLRRVSTDRAVTYTLTGLYVPCELCRAPAYPVLGSVTVSFRDRVITLTPHALDCEVGNG